MQAIRPATTIHHTASEFVNDDDLAVLDDIVDVAAEHHHRAQRLVDVMDDLRVLEIVEIIALEQAGGLQQALDLLGAVFGQRDRALLLVLLIILLDQLLHDRVDRDIQLRLVVGRTGNDQRRARFVDQDRIDFVDDRMVERALDHRTAIELHVIAQIIEAEFIVGRIGDVGIIGLAALVFRQVGHDHTGGEAQEAIDLTHPFAVTAGQIVVHGDDMDALAFKRVQIGGERRHQRLAFAGAHFGDFAAMQDDAADHLDVEVTHAQHADRCFADGRESFGQKAVQRFAIGQALTEARRLAHQFIIAHRLDRRFEGGDLVDDLAQRFHITFVGRSEDRLGECAEHANS